MGEYPNEKDSEDTETNKTYAIYSFMSKILPDHETSEGISYLNLKQREVFNVVHAVAKDYVEYNGYDVKSVHIFFSGTGGTGKSHLMKVIYNVTSKTLLYHCRYPEKPHFLFLGPLEI